MDELIVQNDAKRLKEKVAFLRQPSSYPNVTKVEVLETHMSWVFLTDEFVYKLKKPVSYSFLDFSTVAARYKFCLQEVKVNQVLGGDTYVGVVALRVFERQLRLDGDGEAVDWLVKMKRLPAGQMLHTAIASGTLRNDWVQRAAERLTDFYLASTPVRINQDSFRSQMMKDIEIDGVALLDDRFNLAHSRIVRITTDLLHFLIKHADLFDVRVTEGRIVDAHGDLRPEHICLGSYPLIIDRVEFNDSLRILDIAEELAFLALECDLLGSPGTGQLFLNVYRWKGHDRVPEMLIEFYKAKRAFLRARLSITHLLEENYTSEEEKWRTRCESYLKAADTHCDRLPKNGLEAHQFFPFSHLSISANTSSSVRL